MMTYSKQLKRSKGVSSERMKKYRYHDLNGSEVEIGSNCTSLQSNQIQCVKYHNVSGDEVEIVPTLSLKEETFSPLASRNLTANNSSYESAVNTNLLPRKNIFYRIINAFQFHNCIQHKVDKTCYMTILLIAISASILSVFLIWTNEYFDPCGSDQYYVQKDNILTYNTAIIFGDSLVVGSPRKVTNRKLIEQIRLDTKHWQFIYSAGGGGERITALKSQLDSTLSKYKPRAMIMLWDSDTDQDFSEFTDKQIIEMRSNYTSNVYNTAQKILASGSLLALSGPVLFDNQNDETINWYRDTNRNITIQLGIDYIDLRQAFLNYLQQNPLSSLTFQDGEHFNMRGICLAGKIFSNKLDEWYEAKLYNKSTDIFH